MYEVTSRFLWSFSHFTLTYRTGVFCVTLIAMCEYSLIFLRDTTPVVCDITRSVWAFTHILCLTSHQWCTCERAHICDWKYTQWYVWHHSLFCNIRQDTFSCMTSHILWAWKHSQMLISHQLCVTWMQFSIWNRYCYLWCYSQYSVWRHTNSRGHHSTTVVTWLSWCFCDFTHIFGVTSLCYLRQQSCCFYDITPIVWHHWHTCDVNHESSAVLLTCFCVTSLTLCDIWIVWQHSHYYVWHRRVPFDTTHIL